MLRHRVTAAALALGLAIGLLAFWQESAERSTQYATSTELALPCFEANEAELQPFRVVLDREPYGPLQLSATATATIRGVSSEWRDDAELESLGDCILADRKGFESSEAGIEVLSGPGVLGRASYEWDSSQRDLVVNFGEQKAPVEIVNRLPDFLAADSRTQGLIAYQNGGTLVVEIDPCPEKTERLACSQSSATRVEIALPAEVIGDDTARLSYEPVPAEVSIGEDETVLVWSFEGDPERTRIEIVLPLEIALQNFLFLGWTFEVEVPFASFQMGLGGLFHLSTIAIFFVGWLVVGGQAKAARRYWLRLAGLYAVLGTVGFTSIVWWDLPDFSLISAVLWASIWLLLSWTWISALGATLGVGLVVVGALWEQEYVQAIAVLLLVVMGLATVGRRLADAAEVLPGPETQPLPGRLAALPASLKPTVLSLSAFAVLVGLGALVGAVIGSQMFSNYGFDGILISELIARNLAYVLFAVAGLIVVGAVLFATTGEALLDARNARLAIAFLFSVLVPPASVAWAGIGLPTWIVTLLLVGLTLAKTKDYEAAASKIPEPELAGHNEGESDGPSEREALLARAVSREVGMNQLAETDASVSSGAGSLADVETARATMARRYPTDVTRSFLAFGVHGHWLENARLSAWVGGLVALIPIAGFVWGAAQSAPDQASWSGLLYLSLGVLTEYARWVVAAFAFSAAYTLLPGRLGAVKGACLAGIWAASVLLTELLSRWITGDASDNWIFLSLRMLLFLVAVGALVDLLTVRAAGGTYRRLADLYRVSTLKRQFAYIGPLALAVVALIQQVSAGANADTAEAVINSISRLLGG